MTAFLQAHVDSLALLQAQCAAACTQGTADVQATLALHRADLETDIFPALLTSMAGSDAVCIREMRERLMAQLDALALLWRQLQDQPAQSDVAALRAQCRAIVDFETRELLPMVDRLLDDVVLADLRAAMAARRIGEPGLL